MTRNVWFDTSFFYVNFSGYNRVWDLFIFIIHSIWVHKYCKNECCHVLNAVVSWNIISLTRSTQNNCTNVCLLNTKYKYIINKIFKNYLKLICLSRKFEFQFKQFLPSFVIEYLHSFSTIFQICSVFLF